MTKKSSTGADIEYEIKSLDPNKIHLIEIISPTVQDFANVVEKLRSMIKTKNNIVFAHRRIDLETGQPMESNIRIVGGKS